MTDREFFEQEALKKLRHGDIFTYKTPVITIKTGGRSYGGLSRHALKLGATIPDLALGTAKFIDPYIFVALWSDVSDYTPKLIADCAASVMAEAHRNKSELVALPPLGGREGMKYLWAAEKAIFFEESTKADFGLWFPEHVYVTSSVPDDEP